MARKKPHPHDVAGLGVAAWLLLNVLVDQLVAKQALTKQEAIDIIDQALSSCEQAHEAFDHYAFETARVLLEHSLRHVGGPSRRKPRRRRQTR